MAHEGGEGDAVINIFDDYRETSQNCIFRVPSVLRRQNPEAYTPDVVSIGPFHHRAKQGKEEEGKRDKEEGKNGRGDKDFQLMERVKKSYLKEFLTDMKIQTLEELTAKVVEFSDAKNVEDFEKQARNFYAEPLDISPKEFLKMMIVDGCFLVQLFQKCAKSDLRHTDDPVFNMDCMFHFLCHDILLLENQLPWFVIHKLYRLTLKTSSHGETCCLSLLILKALSIVPSLKGNCSAYSSHSKNDAGFLHILDLVRASIINPYKGAQKTDTKEAKNNPTEEHQDNSGNKVTGNSAAVQDDVLGPESPDQHQICTATALSKADIKFKGVKDRKSIMDIQFKYGKCYRNGTLIIPQLNVGMSSETLFRNLIAAEQCYHLYTNEITSYAIFMDNLISSKEDLDLLCKAKVIGNWLSEEDGCKFFSNLYKDIPHKDFCYVDLCDKVNKRYKLRRYAWLAVLKSEKFSNPWRILAFVIGFIIIVLTAWSSVNNIRRKKK